MPIDDDDDDDDAVTPRTAAQWAMECALKIEKDHGADGPAYVAAMIGKFALERNDAAIDTYKEIARAYQLLLGRPARLS